MTLHDWIVLALLLESCWAVWYFMRKTDPSTAKERDVSEKHWATVVVPPETPHKCNLGGTWIGPLYGGVYAKEPTGTLRLCECGKRWRVKGLSGKTGKWVPLRWWHFQDVKRAREAMR